MTHSLAVADVEAVIHGAANRLLVANAGELRFAVWRGQSVQRSSTAGAANRHSLVDVDGFVLMETENMSVFRLNDRVGIERPAVPNIELLGHWVAVVGVH